MPVYISSNQNRFYCAAEGAYGQVPAITANQRIPAVKLAARQQLAVTTRKDKTGSRTFGGLPAGGRRKTTFDLTTYMTSWNGGSDAPSYGPLFAATLGGQPVSFAGGTVRTGSAGSTLLFQAPHGLSPGQAVTYFDEMRFVSSVIDDSSVQLNAPFTAGLSAGAGIGSTVTYFPATDLPSVSLFDYWSPSTAVHRILCGAGVDRMVVKVNADYHEFQFSGIAQELADSASFSAGIGQLTSFPAEPLIGAFDYSIVPGHLGQIWLGNAPDRFLTLTDATLTVNNALDVRTHEFGSSVPRAIAPGTRAVTVELQLFEQDTTATQGLYQAAKQQSPISVMLQLGQQPGELFGAYLQSVLPEVPEFDDSETRLQWNFRSSRAQGTVDDEITIAFG